MDLLDNENFGHMNSAVIREQLPHHDLIIRALKVCDLALLLQLSMCSSK